MTTLIKAISDSDTVLMFTEDASFPRVNGVLQIGSEIITYDSNYMGTLYGCVRGANSTSAASHAVGASIILVGFFHGVSGESSSFTTVTLTGSTASRALATDASKVIVSSSTTDTELGYVHGVTSAIQTQINALPVVKVLAADPVSPTEGQVWYNTTSHLLKFYDGTTVQTVATV